MSDAKSVSIDKGVKKQEEKARKQAFRQEIIKVNGTEYTLQKMPVGAAFDVRARFLNSDGSINQRVMYEELLENVVVSPKMKIDDFEDIWVLDEVVIKASEFQYGKYVEKK